MRLGLKQEPHPADLIPVSVAWSDRCLSITGYFTHGCKNIRVTQTSNLSAGVVILLFHMFSVLKAENDQLIHLNSFLIFLDTSDSSINKIKFACFSFIIIKYFLMVLVSFTESVFYSFFSGERIVPSDDLFAFFSSPILENFFLLSNAPNPSSTISLPHPASHPSIQILQLSL